ncbi:MAG: DNA polymerase III subunit gamma/tau [Erysipelotrichaceae bacterium]|jgi:DNA polymerase-3 subunit gamma/tau|nr:DNA polymerase III subunit gamma/tau [Erysipelotrichaceae bacterium]
MAYKALYRTYRPSTFEEIAGQSHVVLTLKNAIQNNKLAHAYLFCGPRGTGKTSIAKLLAKAVNCTSKDKLICDECTNCKEISLGNHPDVIEIDAASNNGVDEIRDLIEKVKYAPIQGKYKVYIIDEVHMLSAGASNALLKTLEEPPSHVIFVLATTEAHKLLPTIISRCQRFDFTRVKATDIEEKLLRIVEKEGIQISADAVKLVANLAEGGLRDAESILDQCISYAQGEITVEHVHQIYGITTSEEKVKLINSILNAEISSLLQQLDAIAEKGLDLKRLTQDLMDIFKECVIYAYTKTPEFLTKLTAAHADEINQQRTPTELLQMIDVLLETSNQYRNTSNVQSYLELGLLKLADIGYVSKTEVSQESPKTPVSHKEEPVFETPAVQPAKSAVLKPETPPEPPIVQETTVAAVIEQLAQKTSEPGAVPASPTPSPKPIKPVEPVKSRREAKQDPFETGLFALDAEHNINAEVITEQIVDTEPVTQAIEVKPVVKDEKPAPTLFTQEEEPVLPLAKPEAADIPVSRASEPASEPVIEPESEAVSAKPEQAAELDEEFILSLLVGANKNKRQELSRTWFKFKDYSADLEHAAAASRVGQSTLAAVGEGYMILRVTSQMLANDINEEENRKKIEALIAKELGSGYSIYAVDVDQFKRIVELYQERKENNTLPKPIKFAQPEIPAVTETNDERDQLEKKMISLFGEDGFETINKPE